LNFVLILVSLLLFVPISSPAQEDPSTGTPPLRISCRFVPQPLPPALEMPAYVRIPEEAHAVRLPGSPLRLALRIENRSGNQRAVNLCALSEVILHAPRGGEARAALELTWCDPAFNDFVVVPGRGFVEKVVEVEAPGDPSLAQVGWFSVEILYDNVESGQAFGFDAWTGKMLSRQSSFLNLGRAEKSPGEQELFDSLTDSLVAELGNDTPSGIVPDATPSLVSQVTLGHMRELALPALERGLAGGDDAVRARCVRLLGALTGKRVFEDVTRAAQDESFRVRSAAAAALGSLGDAAGVTVLIELLDDPAEEVRSEAARSLSSFGGDRARDALLEALEGDRYTPAAIRAAGELKMESAVGRLLDLGSRGRATLREEIIHALGMIGDTRATGYVIRSAAHENPRVREEAIKVLGELGQAAATVTLLGRLDDRSLSVKANAVLSLAKLGKDDGYPLAVQIVRARKFGTLGARRVAVEALGTMKLEKGRPFLEEALAGDSDLWVRANAAEALGGLGGTASKAALLGALDDLASHSEFSRVPFWWVEESYPVAEAALGALIRIDPGGEAAYRARFQLARLEKGNLRSREAAADTLVEMGASAARSVVQAAGRGDLSCASGLRLADVLSRIGAPALAPIIEALPDAGSRERALLARALGGIGGEEAFRALGTIEKDTDPYARYAARRALAMLGPARKR